MVKKILLVLLLVLVVMQFIRPAKNVSHSVNSKDISVLYKVPDSVNTILEKACDDCHSDNTRYPWYNNMQPVAWWLRNHINGGKHHLNFSEFGNYTVAKQVKKLKHVGKEVTDGSMPLDSYLWIHKDAILSDAEKKTLINWADSLSQQISVQNKL
ncbi:MAG TPA: heme-binding domain-containing protein [Flavipsychrobacter sp.]|nr:heme-binding domain-containing protein [Flavipsychrobacter sp.]